MAMIHVFALPPKLSCSSRVSLESRYGTWGWCSTSAVITLPNVKRLWLMLPASLARTFLAPERPTHSDLIDIDIIFRLVALGQPGTMLVDVHEYYVGVSGTQMNEPVQRNNLMFCLTDTKNEQKRAPSQAKARLRRINENYFGDDFACKNLQVFHSGYGKSCLLFTSAPILPSVCKHVTHIPEWAEGRSHLTSKVGKRFKFKLSSRRSGLA